MPRRQLRQRRSRRGHDITVRLPAIEAPTVAEADRAVGIAAE